jgi:hypothetical protein
LRITPRLEGRLTPLRTRNPQSGGSRRYRVQRSRGASASMS